MSNVARVAAVRMNAFLSPCSRKAYEFVSQVFCKDGGKTVREGFTHGISG